ncbi:MAG: GntR family transcriptional regulator [Alphaproteobacteria bacterium]|nr:GntR family transcriptional regulator [Alphaproteobacteria bacterium]
MGRAAIATSTKAFDEGDRALVDPREPTPLYHQIYLVLRDRILAGRMEPPGRVPGEFEVARSFGVSRITAKRALDELEKDGLVTRQRGRGTHVRPGLPSRPVAASISGLIENLLTVGLESQVSLIEFERRPPPKDIRLALALAPGDEALRAVRLRSVDAVPLSYSVAWVPGSVGRGIRASELKAHPLLAVLERKGVLIGRAEQTITAEAADARVAKSLGVPLGAPLLSVTRVVFDQDDRPVEHIAVLYRPDRYAYSMSLKRRRTKPANLWT